MFRNVYIEAYKNSIQQNSSLEMMLIHVNYMYAGMGCILQDIQFMVGNVLNHIKTTPHTSSKQAARNQAKQRISMPQKLEEVSFKMPKYQFLPSSSAKYQNYEMFKSKFNEPEQVRSNNLQSSISKKNDSFEEMFPKCRIKSQNEDKSNTRNQKMSSNPAPNSKKQQAPQESQQDFMDYLFNKNRS